MRERLSRGARNVGDLLAWDEYLGNIQDWYEIVDPVEIDNEEESGYKQYNHLILLTT